MTFWDCLLENLEIFGAVLWFFGTFILMFVGMNYMDENVWGWVLLVAGVISFLLMVTTFTYMAQ